MNQAPELIKVLPWGPDFEVDKFKKPDFTALEVVNFATGGLGTLYIHFRSEAKHSSRYSCWHKCRTQALEPRFHSN